MGWPLLFKARLSQSDEYGKCSLLQTLDQPVMLKWKEGYSFRDEMSFAMILLWIRYLFRAKSLKFWLVTSWVSEEAEKGGVWEGTGLVQCFSIRNSFIIKIHEGRRRLWSHHACCQTRASATFSFQRLSLLGQQNDHSLHCLQPCPNILFLPSTGKRYSLPSLFFPHPREPQQQIPLLDCPSPCADPQQWRWGGDDTGWVTGPGSPRTRWQRLCITQFIYRAPCFLSRPRMNRHIFIYKKKNTQAASSEPTQVFVQFWGIQSSSFKCDFPRPIITISRHCLSQ